VLAAISHLSWRVRQPPALACPHKWLFMLAGAHPSAQIALVLAGGSDARKDK